MRAVDALALARLSANSARGVSGPSPGGAHRVFGGPGPVHSSVICVGGHDAAAAAQALDLDFVPLFQERYDLVIPKGFAESELLAPLFDLLTDPVFRNSVSKLTGYDVNVMGRIILED